MNVFIDTNVYLNLYRISQEKLEEIEKVFLLQQFGRVTVLLPQQVEDEFHRNRDKTIFDALKQFKTDRINEEFPPMVRAYEEYENFRKAISAYYKAKDELNTKLQNDIKTRELKADKIISGIFQKATKFPFSIDIYRNAKLRIDRGNPPGKNDSYGDAINWEILLSNVANGEDLHIIANDGDYYSKLYETEINSFLEKEWIETKLSNLFVYKRLSEFSASHFPEAKIATELEKKLAIEDLEGSYSFSRTHSVIRKLNTLKDLTDVQINQIVEAFLTNGQVYSIISDEDVLEFIVNIVENYKDKIKSENLIRLLLLFPDEDALLERDKPQLLEKARSLKTTLI